MIYIGVYDLFIFAGGPAESRLGECAHRARLDDEGYQLATALVAEASSLMTRWTPVHQVGAAPDPRIEVLGLPRNLSHGLLVGALVRRTA
ncbi:hypothetical protein [Nocardia asteroides]|uniref:hypothetical protein n=1 Tax=Nocardia asteroides TaxID=1824 RepID=UPI003449D73B